MAAFGQFTGYGRLPHRREVTRPAPGVPPRGCSYRQGSGRSRPRRLNGRKRIAGQCRLPKIPFVVPIPGRPGRLKLRRQAMRVIVFVKATEDSEKAILPTQEAIEA